MRTLAISIPAILIVSLTFVAPSAARARRHASPQCPPSHSRVVLANLKAEIYEKLERLQLHYDVYGCTYRQKRSYDLGGVAQFGGGAGGGEGIQTEALAGSIVAFEEVHAVPTFLLPPGMTKVALVVRDLRSGRTLHRMATSTGEGTVASLVVREDGAVAWIVEVNRSYEVHAVDATGSRTLAVGADIAPLSLALANGTLYWTQAGKPYSASLN